MRLEIEAMTASNNLVSVIIPSHNLARFLGEAIESVLQQTYPYFEVIVIDDGSTDNSLEVAARYPEVLTIRQENQGVCAARNNGAQVSRGSYLVFLDSDDRLLPWALATGMKQMQDHFDCAFVFGRHREIAADGSLRPTSQPDVIERNHYCRLLLSNFIHTPSAAMFRRSVFESLQGFDPRFTGAEDYELYLRIAREFPVFGYEEIVTEYRRHEANVSLDSALMLKTCLAVVRKQGRYVRRNKEWKEARQIGIRNHREKWGDLLFSQGCSRLREGKEFKGSIKDAITLMRYSPEVFPRRLRRKLSRSCKDVWNKWVSYDRA